MKNLIIILCLMSSSMLFSQETNEDKKYKEKVIEYMNITKFKETFVDATIKVIEENRKTDMPEEQMMFLDDFIIKVKNISQQELMDIFLPPYKSVFTMEDMDQLIKFYSSPVGKKVTEKQAQILAEVEKNSQKYGEKTANEILKKYEKENKD